MKRCVRCGKCLAVCELYKNERREEFSPRGRLLIQSKGTRSFQHCLGCMKCEEVCPYDLSPVTSEETQFVWIDGPSPEPSFSIKNLHDLIYNFNLYEDNFRENFEHSSLSDTLVYSWLRERGIECTLNGKEEDVMCGDGTLFNPFAAFQEPANDLKLEKRWNKLLRSA